MLSVSANIQIPLGEFEFTYARSGGPGGQNVNKVNSKVILRWAVITSPSLTPDVCARFIAKFANRITGDGELVVSSQKFRDQARNVADCLEKLSEMLASVANRPIERRATKPTRGSKERRTESKKEQSQKKARRRRPEVD